eukprot:scaffold20755_cov82-Skeletonema_dohrnii-CCMP3373.AAC.1
MALIVVKCVLRGRPQGGRAVFIVYFGGNVGVVDVDSGINGNFGLFFISQNLTSTLAELLAFSGSI